MKNKPSFFKWWWTRTSFASKLPIPFVWTIGILVLRFGIYGGDLGVIPEILLTLLAVGMMFGITFLPYYTYRGLSDSYFERNNKYNDKNT